MRRLILYFCLLLPLLLVAQARTADERPNIVFILADDLGWNDVGWHGSEIATPHLKQLAEGGVKLEQFHVMPVCSPTRSCLMSGRHPIRTGLQSGVVRPWSTHGLPLDEQTLPDGLARAGYATHLVGKWHLGHSKPEYLPMARGFDHHYGLYCGMIDYFTHSRSPDTMLDWHRDGKPLREEGYSTQLLGDDAVRRIENHRGDKPFFMYLAFNAPHSPLQAPESYVKKYAHIPDRKRRIYAAMVACMDDQVGRVTAALEKRGLRHRTLIMFSSDNGGPTNLGATNTPLRGAKASLYQGGVQVPAFANWPGRLPAGQIRNQILHMVDWYPTILKLGGAPVASREPLDGRDIWATVSKGAPSPHTELLINLEDHREALRRGDWKLLIHKRPAGEQVELFNLAADSSEQTDLSTRHPERVRELRERLDTYRKVAVPARGGRIDPQPPGWRPPAIIGEFSR